MCSHHPHVSIALEQILIFKISATAELTVFANLAPATVECCKKAFILQRYPNKVSRNADTESWLVNIKKKKKDYTLGYSLKRFLFSACPSCSKAILSWKFL